MMFLDPKVKKFIEKSLFFAILTVMVIVATDFFLSRQLEKLPGYSLAPAFPRTADMVIFGSSVLKWTESNGEDEESIYRLLVQRMRGVALADYSDLALSMPDFSAAMSGMRDKGQVKAIVVPVALRSLGPSWGPNPEYERPRQRTFSSAAFSLAIRYLVVLNWPFRKSRNVEEYLKYPIISGGRHVGLVGDYFYRDRIVPDASPELADKVIRDRLLFYYLADTKPSDPNLVSLDHLLAICKAQKIRMFVYVEPINVQRIRRYWGEGGVHIVRRNCQIIAERAGLQDANVTYRDWSFFFDRREELFSIQRGITDEHLLREGRILFAEQLAREIGEMMRH